MKENKDKWSLLYFKGQYQLISDQIKENVIVEKKNICFIEIKNIQNNFPYHFCDFEKLKIPIGLESPLLELISSFFSFMSNSSLQNSNQYIPKAFLPYTIHDEEEITFFSGSFNPWHRGHQECLEQCPHQNIIILPDYNPWKKNYFKNPLKKVLEISKSINNKYPIYPGFLALKNNNFTANWILKTRVKKINYLMGDDSFKTLTQWFQYEEICRIISKIFIIPRRFKEIELKSTIDQIKKINPKIEIFFLKKHEFMNLSSTELKYNENNS